jgi:hypothetical protein
LRRNRRQVSSTRERLASWATVCRRTARPRGREPPGPGAQFAQLNHQVRHPAGRRPGHSVDTKRRSWRTSRTAGGNCARRASRVLVHCDPRVGTGHPLWLDWFGAMSSTRATPAEAGGASPHWTLLGLICLPTLTTEPSALRFGSGVDAEMSVLLNLK